MQIPHLKIYSCFRFEAFVHFVRLFYSLRAIILLVIVCAWVLFAASCTVDTAWRQVCSIKQQISESGHQNGDSSTNSAFTFYDVLRRAGFVNVQSLDSTVRVDLRYSTINNIWKTDLYHDFDSAFLQPDVAARLVMAHRLITSENPHFRMIIYDAVRPVSVQQQLWDLAPISAHERQHFLSDPRLRSLHNFGAAVDVGLVDSSGNILDMGTDFDDANELSYPSLENYFLSNGQLSQKQYANRLVLRRAMKQAGFIQNSYEWWHYSACLRTQAAAKYAVVESFTQIIPVPKTLEYSDVSVDTAAVQFRVQIACSATALPLELFSVKDVVMYKHQGMYKYTIGTFNDLQQTYRLRDSIRLQGYPQAFVVCFAGNIRIDISEAIARLQ